MVAAIYLRAAGLSYSVCWPPFVQRSQDLAYHQERLMTGRCFGRGVSPNDCWATHSSVQQLGVVPPTTVETLVNATLGEEFSTTVPDSCRAIPSIKLEGFRLLSLNPAARAGLVLFG
jgi:hypothetical protein